MCRSLNAVGLKHGDRVGVCMPNYAFYYTMIIAAARLGLVLVGVLTTKIKIKQLHISVGRDF